MVTTKANLKVVIALFFKEIILFFVILFVKYCILLATQQTLHLICHKHLKPRKSNDYKKLTLLNLRLLNKNCDDYI